VDELLRDIGSLEEDHEAGESGAQRPTLHPRPTSADRGRHVRGLRGSRSAHSANSTHSTDDGLDDSDEEDQQETSALHKKRRPSVGSGHGRRHLGHLPAPTDMTASTELTKSMRQYSMGYDDYAETAQLFSDGIMLKKRIVSLYVQLCELKSYVQLNRTGFSKVLKKFDKIIDRELRQKYMAMTVDSAYPFLRETLTELEERIRAMETAYADIVTQGDVTLAKKDLRSHLREHVVWERNTVWRDLIGLERRAAAASLGKGLLGDPNNGLKVRLQGDDVPIAATRDINTPIGRFTCPTWLFGSTMTTILVIIAVFLVLLLVPIMEKPEQQACLAMLVFVSLLWATEVMSFSCFTPNI
jgi:phosphate transporter